MTTKPNDKTDVIGRCAWPGCEHKAVIRILDQASSDILCDFHAEDEIRRALRMSAYIEVRPPGRGGSRVEKH